MSPNSTEERQSVRQIWIHKEMTKMQKKIPPKIWSESSFCFIVEENITVWNNLFSHCQHASSDCKTQS